MVSEKQKYISTSLRISGFALLTPLGSIMFQWTVFKTALFLGNFTFAVLEFVLGFLVILGGYLILKEQ